MLLKREDTLKSFKSLPNDKRNLATLLVPFFKFQTTDLLCS